MAEAGETQGADHLMTEGEVVDMVGAGEEEAGAEADLLTMLDPRR